MGWDIFWYFVIFLAVADATVRLIFLLPRYEQFKEKYGDATKITPGLYFSFGLFWRVPLTSEEAWRKRVWAYVLGDLCIAVLAILFIVS